MKRSYLYLSEFHVGDKFTTLSRTVTETDVSFVCRYYRR